VDNSSPGYFDNNSQGNNGYMAQSQLGGGLGNAGTDGFFDNDLSVDPNTGRLAPANGIGSYYGGGLLYPNLYSLTLGAQNYGNSGGLNNAYNYKNNNDQFAVDNSGADLYGNALNGAGGNFNAQGFEGSNQTPQFNGYANLGDGNYAGGDYAPNFSGDGYGGNVDSGAFVIN
jgi:hypothetical protein